MAFKLKICLKEIQDNDSIDSGFKSSIKCSSEDIPKLCEPNEIKIAKKFTRHNAWPSSHEIRTGLWQVVSKDADFEASREVFKEKMNDLINSGISMIEPNFLSVDGIIIQDHDLKENGVVLLQRLLIIIEYTRPELTYVPAIYSISAIFIHFIEADEAFAVLNRLLGQSNKFLIQSELSYEASAYTLLALLKKYKSKVYRHLEQRCRSTNEKDLVQPLKNWYEWIFKHLPFDYLVRVIDCFVIEGHKFLLRIGIAIIYLWYKNRSKHPLSLLDTPIDQCVEDVNQQLIATSSAVPVSFQTMIDIGIAIKNFKMSTVDRFQKHYEDQVREEVNERRVRKQATGVKYMNHLFSTVFTSRIVNADTAQALMRALPERLQLETPILLFNLSSQGTSFVNLWNKIDEAEQSLFIIKTMKGDVFGGYASSSWVERKDVKERSRSKFFGTGECFVFKIDKSCKIPVIYNWIGSKNPDEADRASQMFMAAGDKFLILGSGSGDAIAIREDLCQGVSYECNTFASPALASERAFEIQELEVFSIHSGCN
uniref:Rab-GAP TBC domain-containing protein n=1 Tax=Rhabditophanes sp. KR3021 TaxID=114890 RepID=A0AC35TPH3_9BILA